MKAGFNLKKIYKNYNKLIKKLSLKLLSAGSDKIIRFKIKIFKENKT